MTDKAIKESRNASHLYTTIKLLHEEFGEDTFWTGEHLASLEAVQRAPPGLPTPIKNCWKFIAPDDEEDYEPNEA